jgi:hypothetical protein
VVVTRVDVRQQTPPGYGLHVWIDAEACEFWSTWVQAQVNPPFGLPGRPWTEGVQPSEEQAQRAPFEQHDSLALVVAP